VFGSAFSRARSLSDNKNNNSNNNNNNDEKSWSSDLHEPHALVGTPKTVSKLTSRSTVYHRPFEGVSREHKAAKAARKKRSLSVRSGPPWRQVGTWISTSDVCGLGTDERQRQRSHAEVVFGGEFWVSGRGSTG